MFLATLSPTPQQLTRNPPVALGGPSSQTTRVHHTIPPRAYAPPPYPIIIQCRPPMGSEPRLRAAPPSPWISTRPPTSVFGMALHAPKGEF
ncbi:hypothetical protein TNCV_2587511 [Trichonephila clavipes]|nr:hypothetical protein TNCV_2587511 [Trichonephila clavipes]